MVFTPPILPKTCVSVGLCLPHPSVENWREVYLNPLVGRSLLFAGNVRLKCFLRRDVKTETETANIKA